MIVIFEKVLAIFVVIGVGFLLAKVRVIGDKAVPILSKLVMLVLLPCLIVSSITTKELSETTMKETIYALVISGIMFTVFSFIGYWLAKLLKFPKNDLGVYTFCFGSTNTGFMGFPITLAIFGEEVFYFMVIINVVLSVYTNGIGQLVVKIGGEKENGKSNWKSLINPCMISIVLSLTLLFTSVHLPEIILDPIDMLGNATIPLSLIVVGIKLSESDFKELIKNVKLLTFSCAKMFVLPIITFFAMKPFSFSPILKIALIMASVYSTAVITTAISEDAKKNSLLASHIVALTTLISMITIPIAATFLTKYFGL